MLFRVVVSVDAVWWVIAMSDNDVLTMCRCVIVSGGDILCLVMSACSSIDECVASV